MDATPATRGGTSQSRSPACETRGARDRKRGGIGWAEGGVGSRRGRGRVAGQRRCAAPHHAQHHALDAQGVGDTQPRPMDHPRPPRHPRTRRGIREKECCRKSPRSTRRWPASTVFHTALGGRSTPPTDPPNRRENAASRSRTRARSQGGVFFWRHLRGLGSAAAWMRKFFFCGLGVNKMRKRHQWERGSGPGGSPTPAVAPHNSERTSFPTVRVRHPDPRGHRTAQSAAKCIHTSCVVYDANEYATNLEI